MNILSVLFAGNIKKEAYENVFDGKNAFTMSVKKAANFESCGKLVILVKDDFDDQYLPQGVLGIELVRRPLWNVKILLSTLVEISVGYDAVFFAFADCPCLDGEIAKKILGRHIKYAADYSYADGYPYGLSPELVSASTLVFLEKIANDTKPSICQNAVKRDVLFSVLEKDINAFDIETEISAVDFRQYRLSLSADSKRNLLLLQRFAVSGNVLPETLRTLPAFYPIEVTTECPQKCKICPHSAVNRPKTIMDTANFAVLLDKIIEFSGDAVIDISLWGELALHPQKIELIRLVLDRPTLSLVIETSGLGWNDGELEEIKAMSDAAAPRINDMCPVSVIVSLDAIENDHYQKMRGDGFEQALEAAKKIAAVFGDNAYIQAVRTKGSEIATEKFYRYWAEDQGKTMQGNAAQVIIQKYDHFCRRLPDIRAADLSPVNRLPCIHNMRDMPILADGTVLMCREIVAPVEPVVQGAALGTIFDNGTHFEGGAANASTSTAGGSGEPKVRSEGGSPPLQILGNVFTDTLDDIWRRGEALFLAHHAKDYPDFCKDCDEYWTFNF
ncbi:MAG: spiro-SPASM protein [Termitinemataceae bacterium]|nr:MAG: spiro-SPASM protein [Termitinemataceae bacterium]